MILSIRLIIYKFKFRVNKIYLLTDLINLCQRERILIKNNE